MSYVFFWGLIKWGAGTRLYHEVDLLGLVCCGGVICVGLIDSLVTKLWDCVGR